MTPSEAAVSQSAPSNPFKSRSHAIDQRCSSRSPKPTTIRSRWPGSRRPTARQTAAQIDLFAWADELERERRRIENANRARSEQRGFLPASGVRADGAASAQHISGFKSVSFTDILSKSFTVPSAGFAYLTASVTSEADGKAGILCIRLTLDGTPLVKENSQAHSS